jgi:hypothetical protein
MYTKKKSVFQNKRPTFPESRAIVVPKSSFLAFILLLLLLLQCIFCDTFSHFMSNDMP